MGFKSIVPLFFFVASVVSQSSSFYRVCVPTSQQSLCQMLDKDGSRVVCESVETRVDCALKLARGTADLGVFSEEELLLISQQQPNDHRIVASIKNVAREDPYAFEAVAIVPSNHTQGFEGLRGTSYCHPGYDETDLRWSPRVRRALEDAVVRTDRCNEGETAGVTYQELQIERISNYFSAACRPGSWSANSTIDDRLKSRYPSLCSLCGDVSPSCAGYTLDMGVNIAGVSNINRHVQAIECLTRQPAGVAYVAWQHVREYFNLRSPQLASSYSILCPDETLVQLNTTVLLNATAPCAFVRQPYGAVVATATRANEVLDLLRTSWPNGVSPGSSTWQGILFDYLVGGSANVAVFQDNLPTPANYTSVRALPGIDTTGFCMPSQRWCTISEAENQKCTWVRQAAYTLGFEPPISCQQRSGVFPCLEDVRDGRADFLSLDSNYGFLARQVFKLSPVKLLQNSRTNPLSLSRVTALVRETTAQANVTRFENLRGKRVCFPEFGGIAYVSFLRTAHERGVISASDCDYARAVGEFFADSCAPGAEDANHLLNIGSSYNTTQLCTSCRTSTNTFTCAANYTNVFYGTNGTLSCLADGAADVVFLETQELDAHMRSLNLKAEDYRALCRNNSLAIGTGVQIIDENCLLALVVDGEVLARRNDPQLNSLNSLLDYLDLFFGYNAAVANQLVNLEIFSPFDSISDLLFKDSAIGLTEPSISVSHEPAKNYFELFRHLESCTGGAAGVYNRNSVVFPLISLVVMTVMSRWVIQ